MQKPLAPPARGGEIADVAARLFNERGLAGTSMADIASELGIKKPTLYHYVQSKAQIVSWIHEACVDKVNPALASYLEQDLPADEILFLVARDILSLLVEKPGYLRVYFENHRDLDATEQVHIVAKRDEYFEMVKTVLERGNSSGLLAVDDVNISALAYFGMCNWAYQWYHADGAISPEDLALHLWRIFLSGARSGEQLSKMIYPKSYSSAVS